MPDFFDELEAMSGFDGDELPEQAESSDKLEGREPQGGPEVNQLRQELEAARQQAREAERTRDQVLREALQSMRGGGRQQQQESPPEDDFGDLDEDVQRAIRSMLQRDREAFYQQFQSQFGPLLEAVQRDQSIKEIDQRVPGFSSELMGEVEQLYNSLPDQEKELYGTRAGIEALAERVRRQKLEQELQRMRSGGRAAQPGVARTVPSSQQFQGAGSAAGGGEVDPWSLKDDEFEREVSRILRQQGR